MKTSTILIGAGAGVLLYLGWRKFYGAATDPAAAAADIGITVSNPSTGASVSGDSGWYDPNVPASDPSAYVFRGFVPSAQNGQWSGAVPSPGGGGGGTGLVRVPPALKSSPGIRPVDARPGAYAASHKPAGASSACCAGCGSGTGGCASGATPSPVQVAISPHARYGAMLTRAASH